jgi:type I restriction enzyme S subunit
VIVDSVKVASWPMVRVGDISQSVNGRAFKSTEWAQQGTPIIRIQNLNRKDASFNYFEGIVDERIRVRDGDLLFAWSGTPGTSFGAHIWRGPYAALNQHIFKLSFDRTQVDSKFFYYALNRNVAGYIEKAQGGVGLAHVTKSKFENSLVPLPTISEQREIVAELEKQFSRLDEAVANLLRVKVNLKRYKASVLKAAVEGRLVETEATLARREGRTYETGEQLLQRILEERRSKWSGKGKYKEPVAPTVADLPELPEGWTWATMPQLGELNRGKSKHRPRDAQELYGGPYPFIQTGDVRRSDGSIKQFTQTYSEVGLAQSRLWSRGTLCITIAANIAETGILKMEACFPDSVVGFIPYLRSPTVEYVECFIRTARDGLDRFASATAQKNINLEVLEAVAVPTPPLAEQIRIVAEVDRHLSIIREVEAEVDANLQRAQALRQATLAKAFAAT